MNQPRVSLVLLRRPRGDDQRSDPYYEFGSFGCTTCHSSNLLHPRHAGALHGRRLAFAQGGNLGFRLVFLTPPIREVRMWFDPVRNIEFCEVLWKPGSKQFKYDTAPVLAWNPGRSDFSRLSNLVREADRTTVEGRFASCFRSMVRPLPVAVGKQVVAIYDQYLAKATGASFATTYVETLPRTPLNARETRRGSYRRRIRELVSASHRENGVSSAPGEQSPNDNCASSPTKMRPGARSKRKC